MQAALLERKVTQNQNGISDDKRQRFKNLCCVSQCDVSQSAVHWLAHSLRYMPVIRSNAT